MSVKIFHILMIIWIVSLNFHQYPWLWGGHIELFTYYRYESCIRCFFFFITVEKCLSRNKSVKERFVSVPGMRDMVHPTRNMLWQATDTDADGYVSSHLIQTGNIMGWKESHTLNINHTLRLHSAAYSGSQPVGYAYIRCPISDVLHIR